MSYDNGIGGWRMIDHVWRVNIKGLLQIVYGLADRIEAVEKAGGASDDDYKDIADAFAMCGASALRCAEFQIQRDATGEKE